MDTVYVLQIISAAALPLSPSQKNPNAYVKTTSGSFKHETKVIQRNREPVWNEEIKFTKETVASSLHFSVRQKGLFNALAQTEIEITELLEQCKDRQHVELDLTIPNDLCTNQTKCRIRLLLRISNATSSRVLAATPVRGPLGDFQHQAQADQESSGSRKRAKPILTTWMKALQLSRPATSQTVVSQACRQMSPERDQIGDQVTLRLLDSAKRQYEQFQQTDQQSDLQKAVSLYYESLDRLSKQSPTRLIVFDRLGNLLTTLYRQTGQIGDADKAIEMYREALKLCPAPHPLRSMSLNNLGAVLHTRFDQTGQMKDLNETIALFQEILELIPVFHPQRTSSLNCCAALLSTRFRKTGQVDDLDKAIGLRREELKLLSALHPDRSNSLNNLAADLHMRIGETSHINDADEAVALYREVLDLRPAPHPRRLDSLSKLALLICRRFSMTGQIEDLDQACALNQEALELTPATHPDRPKLLDTFTIVLGMRFSQTSQIEHLNKYITLQQEVLKLRPAPHPDRSDLLSTLAPLLSERFDRTGQVEDADEAVALYREVLELRPAPHPHRSDSLDTLSILFCKRFHLAGRIDDLDQACALNQEALELTPATHSDRPNLLNTLAVVLGTRFKQTGQIEYLNRAITLHQEVLKLRPAPHPGRSSSLSNLAIVLSARFSQTGQSQDLDEAIRLHREALELTPVPDLPLLNNFATALHKRFSRTGEIADVDKAVALYREAVKLKPAGPFELSNSLSNLAALLSERFSQINQIEDANEAIALHREALVLRPACHPNRPDSLIQLAETFNRRFRRTNNIDDVDEAIALSREALSLRPAPHAHRSGSLDILASSLERRFDKTGKIEDINEAITLLREAIDLSPIPHPGRPVSLNSLADAFWARFRQLKQLTDANEAITKYHQALRLLPRDSPKNCTISNRLGLLLLEMFVHTQQPTYLNDVVSTLRTAVTCRSAPTQERITAARLWVSGAYSEIGGLQDSALEAYQHMIELLPRLAMSSLDLQARQQALASGIDGLARDAAAWAVRFGHFDKAVEFLEQGRNIFWSRALQLRTPLDNVHCVAPNLAQKLQKISHALEKGAFRDMSRSSSDTERQLTLEQETAYYRSLDKDWVATLEEIRRLDGFGDFLRPDSFTTLQRAAANGPVVILNASEHGCDALVMTLSVVEHVPLPKFTMKVSKMLIKLIQSASGTGNFPVAQLQALVQETRSLLEPSHRDDRGMKIVNTTPDDIFRCVLATLWTSVAAPVIRSLALTKSESPPRLWWCPTGVFTFLPIHAAGVYGVQDGERVSDYVVSSYTPTLSSRIVSLPPASDSFKIMAVIQPHVRGYPSLPFTRDELERIEKHVPHECLVTLGIPDAPATVENVLSHLSTVSIVHFACHGVQDAKRPLESALVLEDGEKLNISRIMEQPMPNGSLAFLSACQTAMGDGNLPDEAIHLAASLLFSGFHGAVATMWSMQDDDGPKIADSFYGNLFKTHEFPITDISHRYPDGTQAARALHLAVAKLRDEKYSFKRWVPFIHLGM